MIKPKHQQLFDLLLDEFHSGLWPHGEKLPSQKELAMRYSVSVNVVSQALELLKQKNLVQSKKGDGIYSIYSPAPEKMIHKYSGERVFGSYDGAKTLSVIIEDHQNWQLEFWNKFFDDFAAENPDIELNVHYANPHTPQPDINFDIIIGGPRFIARTAKPGCRLLRRIAFDFYSDLDDGLLLDSGNFADGIFPVGFVASCLLTRPGTPEPLGGEGIFDYIERTIEPGKGALLLRYSTELFQNNGIDVLNRCRRALDQGEKERLTDLFERAANLYRDGRLLWPHGRFADPEQSRQMLYSGSLTVLGRRIGGEIPEPSSTGVKKISYPHGSKAMLVPIMAVLDKRSCFAEEQLRLVKKLRTPEQQRAAMSAGIFQPLHREVLPQTSPLLPYLLRGDVEYSCDADPVELRLVDYIMNWELLYNMTGRRGKDAVELLDKKIRYYYKNADNINE